MKYKKEEEEMIKEFLANPIYLKYTICYLVAINIFGFLIMGIDKFKAKKGYWRTPEKTLFIITLLRRRIWHSIWNVCI